MEYKKTQLEIYVHSGIPENSSTYLRWLRNDRKLNHKVTFTAEYQKTQTEFTLIEVYQKIPPKRYVH